LFWRSERLAAATSGDPQFAEVVLGMLAQNPDDRISVDVALEMLSPAAELGTSMRLLCVVLTDLL
jgi:hypothetical protein